MCFFYLFSKIKINIDLMYRPETPPNTPQRVRAAARQNERNNRTLDSPQHHRTPHQPVQPHIPPLQFGGIPLPQHPPLPGNMVIPDDPFALPAQVPAAVHFNGHQYGHLPQHLAQQLQNLPPVPLPLLHQGQGRGQLPPVSLILFFG
jgi:hypothetical protein